MKKLRQYILVITVCVIAMVGCESKSSGNKYRNGERNSLDESSITINTQDIYGFATADKVSNVGPNSVKGAIQAQSSEDAIMRLFTINENDSVEEVQGRYELKKVESVSAGWLVKFEQYLIWNGKKGRFFYVSNKGNIVQIPSDEYGYTEFKGEASDGRLIFDDRNTIRVLDQDTGGFTDITPHSEYSYVRHICGDFIAMYVGNNASNGNSIEKIYSINHKWGKNLSTWTSCAEVGRNAYVLDYGQTIFVLDYKDNDNPLSEYNVEAEDGSYLTEHISWPYKIDLEENRYKYSQIHKVLFAFGWQGRVQLINKVDEVGKFKIVSTGINDIYKIELTEDENYIIVKTSEFMYILAVQDLLNASDSDTVSPTDIEIPNNMNLQGYSYDKTNNRVIITLQKQAGLSQYFQIIYDVETEKTSDMTAVTLDDLIDARNFKYYY